jgi:hypothetical protein
VIEKSVRIAFKPEKPRHRPAPTGAGVTVYVPGKALFHTVRNRATSGTDVTRIAVRQLRKHLPATWRLTEGPSGSEATIVLRAPDSRVAHVVVVSKRRIEPKDVAAILTSARVQRPRISTFLVAAPFLSPRTCDLLASAGVSYLDGTGNIRVTLERPSVFIEARGAEKDPAREPRPLGSLKGPASGRVVRALCDFRPPYGIRALAERCSTAPASVSRVVALLEREAIVVRGVDGEVAEVDWATLLRRWARDHRVTSSSAAMTLLEPDGVDALLQRLRRSGRPYAITGGLAAQRKAPAMVARLAMVYVADPSAVAEALELRAADRGIKVVLVAPFDPVVFDRNLVGERPELCRALPSGGRPVGQP